MKGPGDATPWLGDPRAGYAGGMWILFAAPALAQAPVLLRPDPSADAVWGTSTTTERHSVVGSDAPPTEGPTVVEHHARFAHPDGLRTLHLFPQSVGALAWLHPQQAVERVVALDAVGTPTEVTVTSVDTLPFIGAEAPTAPDLEPGALARGTCGPLLFFTLLPADPVPVGATWGAGNATCRRQPDVDGNHQVVCRVGGRWEDVGADHRQRGVVTLTVTPERTVARCERESVLQREVEGEQGPLIHRTDTNERYERSAPQAIGWGLGAKLAALGVGAFGLLGLGWMFGRRRTD